MNNSIKRYIDSFMHYYYTHDYIKYFYFNKYYQYYCKINNKLDDISAFDNEYRYNYFCCSCLNPKYNDLFIKLNCGHQMHCKCYIKYIKLKYTLCPFCKNTTTNYHSSKDTFIYNSYQINELYYN
uniref:RING-type domain-containing protein n=1 Tax=viral metagenome TaxID=1070528 RepID=A0A6C0I6M7_9ZZZZ